MRPEQLPDTHAGARAPPPTTPLNLVLVEDVASDADLVLAELRRAGYDVRARIVATEAELLIALYDPPQVVISDYSLPQFDGLRALEVTASIDAEIPFILVSGTVSEELAVTALHRGAADYVAKDRMARLGAAVGRALELRAARAAQRRAEAAVREREARLRAILDNEPECVKLLASDRTLVEMNRAGLAMLEAESVDQVRGEGLLNFVLPEHRARFAEVFAQVQLGTSCTLEFEIVGLKGTRRWMEMHAAPLQMPNDPGIQLLSVTRDITAQKLAEIRLLRLNRMHALLSGINSLIVRARRQDELLHDACRLAAVQGQFALAWIGMLDRKSLQLRIIARDGARGALVDALPAATGFSTDSGTGFIERCVRSGSITVARDLERDATSPLHGPAVRAGLASAVALPLLSGGEVAGVMALYAPDAGFFVEEELRLLGDLAGDVSFALTHIAMRERAEFVAMHDVLTGLPNRNLLVDRADQALRARSRRGKSVAVVFLSIERFRGITESLGRQVGDELLRRVAERLQVTARREDTLARAGERRFAMLMDGLSDPAEASTLLNDRILRAFERPVRVGEQEFHLKLKAGIAIGDAPGLGGEELCANAERALWNVRGKADRYSFYEPEMNARVAESIALERKLRVAIEAGQFVLHYQPIVQAGSGKTVGLEALIRWNDPERGLVAPGQFIPLMEETGLIVAAGRWVVRRAIEDVRAWRGMGMRVPPVAVNVSALQLRDAGFVQEVCDAVGDFAPGEKVLSIEVTESVLVENIDVTAASLARLRDAGVVAAIDDFGTGYSSLAYVAGLPVGSLKIDRAFTARLHDAGSGRSIVTMVIALGHALGLRVVAEGVETPQQIELLTELGCDELQGFAIARPAAAADIAALLAGAA